jgi:hypothetical protein
MELSFRGLTQGRLPEDLSGNKTELDSSFVSWIFETNY